MASSDSTDKLSDVLASLSETMTGFRSESVEVESEFFELINGLGGVGPVAVRETVVSEVSPAFDSETVGRLESLDRPIAEQRLEFAGKQDKLPDDVGQLRAVVDQQAQLSTAWIKSAANLPTANPTSNENQEVSSEDEVLSDVFAQFKELTGTAVGGEVPII